MASTFQALAPILGLIVLGYVLKRLRFLSAEGWSGIERLTYFVLFPALLISTLGGHDLGRTPLAETLAVVLAGVTVAIIALLFWRWRAPSMSGPTFTSIFQGGVRFNTYVALALIQALYGSNGLIAGAVAIAIMIPLVNIASVTVFAIWGANPVRGLGAGARELLLNPLILACAAGGAIGVSGWNMPASVDGVLEILGRAALPLGLLAVGAALKPEEVRGHLGPALGTSLIQFGLKPFVAFALTTHLSPGAAATGALMILFMTPTAPASYILARQLGGDTSAMASIVTLQTLLAFAAIPALASVLLP